MKLLNVLAILALLCCFVSGVRAEDASPPDYVVGQDDVLDISVRNHSLLDKTVTVLPDGKITFPSVGAIKAAGRTLKEIGSDIQTELEKTLNNVEVVVGVKEVHSRKASIVGAVKTSGVFDMKRNWRLMDLVAAAGGLSAKPIRISGRIIRGSAEVLSLDLVTAVEKPDSEANMLLKPGDLALLDELDVIKQVHVMGEVAHPGAFDLNETLTIVSLISEAGSQTEKAALSKAYVLRGPTRIPFDLIPILLKGKADPNVTSFKFQAGDVLFIPEIEARYAVLGEVLHPGYFPVSEKEEMTVLKALSLAGGQSQEGDLRRASILHVVDGKPVARPVNIEEMLKKGKLAANVALQADDILVIPPRKKPGNALYDVIAPLTLLSLFGIRIGR